MPHPWPAPRGQARAVAPSTLALVTLPNLHYCTNQVPVTHFRKGHYGAVFVCFTCNGFIEKYLKIKDCLQIQQFEQCDHYFGQKNFY